MTWIIWSVCQGSDFFLRGSRDWLIRNGHNVFFFFQQQQQSLLLLTGSCVSVYNILGYELKVE